MKVIIVDYGLGNIFSIQRAIAYLGHKPLISDKAQDILKAERVILPGVGAFGDGMQNLRVKGLDEVLLECAASGKLILGICLGMQLLMSESEEFGLHKGLNLISGRVTRLPKLLEDGTKIKIPHVGWNQIFPKDSKEDTNAWEKTILSENSAGDFFYFIHSYRVIPENREDMLAITEYYQETFCSVVRKRNIFGCQFHPELSGEAGLKIYRQFMHSDKEAYV